MERLPNPILGSNPFKLGLFNANCDGGFAISTAPERWGAEWDDIVTISLMADEAGIDFILPVAKWRGLGGDADNLGRSFETMTHSAAIGALTKRIGMFVTVHVPVMTPAFAAKSVATIDHITHGRAGLNIVCGWNQAEFDVHGVTIDAARRYEQGLEWFQIFARLLEGGPPFDWSSDFYQLRGLTTNPVTLQRPRPPIMSAGFSLPGRDFAAQAADLLFTSSSSLDVVPDILTSVHDYAGRYGRRIEVYLSSHIVCRPTRREAEEFYRYFADEHADHASLANFRQKKAATSTGDAGSAVKLKMLETPPTRPRGPIYPGSYPGTYCFVGTPDDIVDEMVEMHRIGLSGTSIAFLNYLDEMPYFLDEVLPRMKRAGLRH
jgi:alkanesulfonate monooxygenase SsuD/methylene tetrahydromethanopterin reductase-like flavin-dependent oxidoreductase (luciferase family)